MTLEEAIEIMNNLCMRGYKLTTKEHYAALKLAIEALKRIKYQREHPARWELPLLPGETA